MSMPSCKPRVWTCGDEADAVVVNLEAGVTAGRHNRATLSKDWGTPQKYVAAARAALGGVIHLDPCSNAWSIVGAQTSWRLPETDGLVATWNFPTIYVNPPYGADRDRGARIGDWLRKCAHAHVDFGAEVVALVPVAANTRHWKESVWARASAIGFLYDTRLKFLEFGRDTGKGAPMACAAVYWGAHTHRFATAFAPHGAVVPLAGIRLPDSADLTPALDEGATRTVA